jgi:MYND finger
MSTTPTSFRWNCSALEKPQHAHKKCSNCYLALYCSRNCQARHWKAHERQCKRLQQSKVWGELNAETISVVASFLDLKEKAMVCSLSKAWLDGATRDEKVSILIRSCGPNLDSLLKFVGSRFRQLREVSIKFHCIFAHDALALSWVPVVGSLNRFFHDCPVLRKVYIMFPRWSRSSFSEEEALATLSQRTALQSLSLGCGCFRNHLILSQLLESLTNLRHLTIAEAKFHRSPFCSSRRNLLATIGRMTNLCSLSLSGNPLEDEDLQQLLPVFCGLRQLNLLGEKSSNTSLTNASLQLIATHCRLLQVFVISRNRRVTIDGLRMVLEACPLRELHAGQVGLLSSHLTEAVGLCPTLRVVVYAVGGEERD